VVAGTAVVVAWLVVAGAVVVVGAVSADPPPQADAANRTVTNTPIRLMVSSLPPLPEGAGVYDAFGVDRCRTDGWTGYLAVLVSRMNGLCRWTKRHA